MPAFELSILDAIQRIRFPALDRFMVGVSYLGEWGVFFSVVTLLLLVSRKTRATGITCTLALVLSFLVVDLTLKPLIARPRPYTVTGFLLFVKPPSDFSFPSGHTSISFAFAAAIWPLGRKYGILAYVLATVIGFSRLYLYVHYPTDVLGGILIGSACGLLARWIYRRKWTSRIK